ASCLSPLPAGLAICVSLRPLAWDADSAAALGWGADFAAGCLVGLSLSCAIAYSRASAVAPLPRISLTFLPRRCATERGLTERPSASKVALIMLCGLEVPIDFATTSWTPSA